MTASFFGSVHGFFHSALWTVIEAGFVVFVVLLYVATVYWVNKDARRRIADPFLVTVSTLAGAVPPFLGPLVYMLFRPPEYLADVRERELEIKAIETRLGGPDVRCGVCGSAVEDDYLVCPVCTAKLRQACTSCGKPLEPAWQVCPYCEAPVTVEAPVSLAPSARTTRTRNTG